MTESEVRDDLTVVIVTYEIRQLIGACLESVRAASEGLNVAVHLVENGSTDGTEQFVAANFPEVHKPFKNRFKA